MKTEIYINEKAVLEELRILEETRETAQEMCEELEKTGQIFSDIEITTLLRKGGNENSIKDLIIKNNADFENFRIGGIKIKHEKLRELLDTPNIENASEAICKAKNSTFINFIIIEKGEAKISVEAENRIKEKNTIFATTDEQLKVANILKNAANALNELYDLTGICKDVYINGLEVENKRFIPDFKYLKR